MKVTDIQTITFRTPSTGHGTKWGYGVQGELHDAPVSILRIDTDDGAVGYSAGGYSAYFQAPPQATVDALVKPLLLGEDPLDRERLWQWMMGNRGFSEEVIGSVDCALWDLLGRTTGVPVYKLLGGARDKVKAYASTAPNLGSPEVYAEHALECKKRGYTAFKVHAYIYWDPYKNEPAPGKPAFPKADVEVCKAVREAVGDDMVLMMDPWGVYTYQESLYVGRELEKLNYYWLEHPMDERRMEPYKKLTRELDINILSPEAEPGSVYSRADWALHGASDMSRIDVKFAGITGCRKTVDMCESIGMQCEIHIGGFGNLAILGSTAEETCEYYERGLTIPGVDRDATPEYLQVPCDPMDDDGYVQVPQGPGLGIEFNWDYINDNLIEK